MTSSTRIFAWVLLLTSSAHGAGHDWPAAPRDAATESRLSLSLDNRSGIVTAPFVTSAFPVVSGFATRLTPSIAYRVSSLGWLRARLPITYVRLDFPAGAQVGEAALGSLELAFEREVELRPATRLGWVAGLLAPTADSGPSQSLLNNRALALSSALTGGSESFLLNPGTTGFRLGASIEHWHAPFQFRASLEVPVLVRVSKASLPDDASTHALGIAAVPDVRAAAWVTSWLGVSFGAALVAEAIRVQEPTRASDRGRRFQPVLEPGLQFRLSRHVHLALEGSIPCAGALGGRAWSIGPRGRLEL